MVLITKRINVERRIKDGNSGLTKTTFSLEADVAVNEVNKHSVTDVELEVHKEATHVAVPAPPDGYGLRLSYCLLPALLDKPHISSFKSFTMDAYNGLLNWIPRDFPIDKFRRAAVESELSRFLRRHLAKENKVHSRQFYFRTMKLSVTIRSFVLYNDKIEKTMPPVDDDDDDDEGNKQCCSICLEELKMMSIQIRSFESSSSQLELCVQLCCSHAFHLRCIATWLAEKNSCPLCLGKQSYCDMLRSRIRFVNCQ